MIARENTERQRKHTNTENKIAIEQCTELQFALCWPSLNMLVERPTGTGEQSKYIYTLLAKTSNVC